MATYNLQLPRMGESVSEATIVKWLKQPGDYIEEDEPILEVATDKVDSDVPSPVSGTLGEQFFAENAVAQVGDIIATIEIDGAGNDETSVATDAIDDETTDNETIE
ncbi:MAG TPA: biotin/lipoyl-containing protein, partial [Parapedobacter sp.]|nr:biotin/lipoyl-containing protein [Parapedobacter sp.]